MRKRAGNEWVVETFLTDSELISECSSAAEKGQKTMMLRFSVFVFLTASAVADQVSS